MRQYKYRNLSQREGETTSIDTIKSDCHTIRIARSNRLEALLFIGIGDEDTGRVDHNLIDGIEKLLLLHIGY